MSVNVDHYYRKFGPMVLRRCRALLKHDEKAVDAAHDVFVQLLRHQERLTDEQPASLLLRISTRVCLNRLRTERRRPEDADDEVLLSIAAAEEPEERSTVRSVLRRMFAQESDSTRTIAVMHLVDGLTLEEVSREVGLSVSGVRKRLRTLRARVAQLEGV